MPSKMGSVSPLDLYGLFLTLLISLKYFETTLYQTANSKLPFTTLPTLNCQLRTATLKLPTLNCYFQTAFHQTTLQQTVNSKLLTLNWHFETALYQTANSKLPFTKLPFIKLPLINCQL